MKNRTLLFGEGLFETFRVYPGRKLPFVDEHLARMADGCRFFSLPFSREEAKETLKSALAEIPPEIEARLRLNLISYGNQRAEKTAFQTAWEPLQEMATWDSEEVKLCVAPFQRFSLSPVVRFKTTSYLENIFVFSWAREQGFFDALFTNERREITEGSISNMFFLRQDEILTPPLNAGLLPGITRKQIIEVVGTMDCSVVERTIKLSDLERFDGAFVTNAIVEILPVHMINDTKYEISEIIDALRDGYRERVEASLFPPIR
jgi:branched-subunit amino acid aminotransferase/4-amino-4-deoxychorismate lyase